MHCNECLDTGVVCLHCHKHPSLCHCRHCGVVAECNCLQGWRGYQTDLPSMNQAQTDLDGLHFQQTDLGSVDL